MDNTTNLTAIVGTLQVDVQILITQGGGGGVPVSVQPAIDAATAALVALDNQVKAATTGGGAPVSGAPVITNAQLTGIVSPVGGAFGFQISATGTGNVFSAVGLPPGLTIDPALGLISGTPTVAGATFPVVTVTNPQGSVSGTLGITIQ
jgi:hypothetical protein